MSIIRQYNDAMNAASTENQKRILKALREAGVTVATADYSGYGDSGQYEEVDIQGGDTKNVSLSILAVRHQRQDDGSYAYIVEEQESSLESAVSELFYGWVEQHHSGYENNDGGRGDIRLQVDNGEVTWQHYDYYTESEQTDHDWRIEV